MLINILINVSVMQPRLGQGAKFASPFYIAEKLEVQKVFIGTLFSP
jgi:hypothetical protein